MQYDIIIIGGGPGGYVAAIRGAQLGAKVVLVEQDTLGGVCLNRGCIPTKTLLRSAALLDDIQQAQQYGIEVSSATVNFTQMMQRKKQVVNTLVAGIKGLMKANGIEVIKGQADISAPGQVCVGDKTLTGRNIIIAVGSSPVKPPIPGADQPNVITSDEALALENVPQSLAVIGGGVIGVEMALLFNSLGCEVTIIEMMDRIVPMVDADISTELEKLLKKRGIPVITGARVEAIHDGTVRYSKEGASQSIAADKVLVSAGRRSNGNHLSLDKLGIQHTKGIIATDAQLRTNVPGIYAIGDVNGKYMLAHVASAEGIVAVENIMGHEKSMEYDAIPQCIYTFPEIASVGITEAQAKEQGDACKVSRFPVMANGKALAEGHTQGFVKMIAEEKYGQILGVHIMAPHATDMISQCAMAMTNELTVDELANTIFPHPTISEILLEASHGVLGGTIHFKS